jgi:putative protease
MESIAPRVAAPELLAPAGDWDAMRAAVANGANAVYFGLQGGFNARYRAENFAIDELPRVMDYLHGHNVRGYVAFNTLVFSDELAEALRFVRAVAEAGADAIIVQDLGLARLIGRMCPGLHVHGSTQMTLTEPLGVEFVKRLGVRRVILARELSTSDVRKITAATDVPVEVFVHGALCVSYSGQCLTSEAIGGRSANRGQCAQACRLPYDLVVDGKIKDLGDKSYLLSPQDLAAHDLIADLAEIGVCSFKIEGRLKSAHYVAATTQTYRAAIDAASSNQPFHLSQRQALDLAQSFSRGFTHGFLDGPDHRSLVHARFPKSRGVRVGVVAGHSSHGVLVRCGETPRPQVRNGAFVSTSGVQIGDGIVFDEGHPEQDEQGGRVVAVRPVTPSGQRPNRNEQLLELTFDRAAVNPRAVAVGATVWKTDDPAVRRRLAQSFSRDVVARRTPLGATVSATVGSLLTVTVRDDAGHCVTVTWDRPLEAAQKHPLTESTFRDQFGRLGDTPFELTEVRGLESPSGAMVPKSVLNDLRRQAVEQLLTLRDDPSRRVVVEPHVLENVRAEIRDRYTGTEVPGAAPDARTSSTTPRLHVLARTMDQLRAVLDGAAREGALPVPVSSVYCEFEDIRQYKDAVALARGANVPIGLATVRIIKPGEEGLLRQVAACEPDCVLVRNLAGLSFYSAHFPHLPLVADYALNVANEATAALLADHGVRRMVPSYDLSWPQLAALLGRFPPSWFEAVVHQHMPMFHMEHCVFCHTLSNGKDHRDCGRPCDRHRVDLRDRAGAANPLVADVGCRNTMYNAQAQTGIEYIPKMREMGITDFRVELLRENHADVAPLLRRYAEVLSGHADAKTAIRSLRVLNQLGVTRGTLDG